ncbi:hypothetical protein [uncultured Sphingosinicella sp.]|uniref:hypothetical protein n=1 Tax=uncultured Sphingosinicella sp. TaxID=478748 RepID=UPI0030DCAF15
MIAARPDQVFTFAFRGKEREFGGRWLGAAVALADRAAKAIGPDDRIEGFRVVECVRRFGIACPAVIEAAFVAKQSAQNEKIDVEQIIDDTRGRSELVFGAHKFRLAGVSDAVGRQNGGENADRQQGEREGDSELKRQRTPWSGPFEFRTLAGTLP